MRYNIRSIIRYLSFAAVLVIALYAFPGSTEIDEQVFAINVGIDKLDNGLMRLTVQMPSGEQGGSGETPGGGSGQSGDTGSGSTGQQGAEAAQLEEARKIQQASQQAGYLIATADGVNYPDALNMMTATLPRLLNMSRVKQVVISERFASDSDAFRKLMERLVYDNEFYNAAQMVICEGEAEAFLREQRLILGARLSKAQDAADYAHLLVGLVPSAHISSVFFGMNSGYGDGIAALCATNLFTAGSDAGADPDASGAIYAGQAARTGPNLNEYIGSALFDDNCMVGKLTGYETQMAHILAGTLNSMLLMEDGDTAQLTQRSQPRVNIDLSGDVPRIEVQLELYIKLHQQGMSLAEAQTKLQNDMSALIDKCQRLGVEPFGFGAVAVRQFLTFADWNQYDWRERFAAADVQIQVELMETNL